jgi:hypothetical protein
MDDIGFSTAKTLKRSKDSMMNFLLRMCVVCADRDTIRDLYYSRARKAGVK